MSVLIISELSRGVCRETIFDCIVSTLRQRIHGRLQSEVWKPPAHLRANPKEPLHQVLKGSTLLDHDVRLSALELCACLRTADDHPTGSDEEYETLKRIILLCYSFSTEPAHRKFLGRASTSRRLSQIAKLARYRSCCLHLIDASRRYPELFQHTELQLHIRFSPDKTRISPGLPLTEYHVHAEIQLLMFFACDSGNDVLKPRVIGVSKSACYLCYMFFCYYGAYYLSRSHGRLYDKWTIPDILNDAALLNERDKIRGILAQMVSNTARSLLVERLRKKKVYTRWPVESGVTLSLASSESPLPSDAATIVKSPSISASIVSGMRIRSTLRLPLPSASVRDNPIESRISTTPTRNSDIANTTSTYPGLPQFKNPTELPSSRKATSHPSSNTLPALSTHSIPQAHAKSQAVSLEKSSPPLQQLPISTTSHSTVSSRTLPTTQTISPNHPWRTKYNGIHMIFELEAGNTCEEATVHLAESQASCETLHDNTFDLRKLVLGEPTLLRRASGADAIMLNLVQGGRKARTEVTLRWA